jgi:hypothetical protein
VELELFFEYSKLCLNDEYYALVSHTDFARFTKLTFCFLSREPMSTDISHSIFSQVFTTPIALWVSMVSESKVSKDAC